jgi:hypothetical protein
VSDSQSDEPKVPRISRESRVANGSAFTLRLRIISGRISIGLYTIDYHTTTCLYCGWTDYMGICMCYDMNDISMMFMSWMEIE